MIWGMRRGRANAGDKILTLVASALAGGDCINDADALRAGGTGRVLGCAVKAPSTLGTFLRSFRWGHVRQLDRVSRELLARAWDAGAGPGDSPLTIDLDSTVCETYGLGKEGARHHNYTGQRGYHPLLAVAAGTGDVLMARLRAGRANTARGAAHFLRETLSRVRYAGATGQHTVRADSGFYTHDIVTVCRNNDVRFSITVRQHRSLRDLIEAIPEADWTPIPYWMEGAADVAETTYTPFRGESDTAPVRLIVRRVRPTPGSQLALFTSYSYHAFITDREGDTLELEADHRRHAEIENAIRDLKYGVGLNHLPSGRFAANAAWMQVTVPHNLNPLDRPHRSGGAGGDHQRPFRRRFFALVGRLTRSGGAVSLCISRRAGPGGTCSVEPWRDCAPCHPLSDGGNGFGTGKRYANLVLINRPDQGLLNSRRMDRRRFPTASGPSVGAPHPCRWTLPADCQRPHLPEIRPARRAPRSILSRYSTVTTCFGGFGLKGSGNDTIPVVRAGGNSMDLTTRTGDRPDRCATRMDESPSGQGQYDTFSS